MSVLSGVGSACCLHYTGKARRLRCAAAAPRLLPPRCPAAPVSRSPCCLAAPVLRPPCCPSRSSPHSSAASRPCTCGGVQRASPPPPYPALHIHVPCVCSPSPLFCATAVLHCLHTLRTRALFHCLTSSPMLRGYISLQCATASHVYTARTLRSRIRIHCSYTAPTHLHSLLVHCAHAFAYPARTLRSHTAAPLLYTLHAHPVLSLLRASFLPSVALHCHCRAPHTHARRYHCCMSLARALHCHRRALCTQARRCHCCSHLACALHCYCRAPLACALHCHGRAPRTHALYYHCCALFFHHPQVPRLPRTFYRNHYLRYPLTSSQVRTTRSAHSSSSCFPFCSFTYSSHSLSSSSFTSVFPFFCPFSPSPSLALQPPPYLPSYELQPLPCFRLAATKQINIQFPVPLLSPLSARVCCYCNTGCGWRPGGGLYTVAVPSTVFIRGRRYEVGGKSTSQHKVESWKMPVHGPDREPVVRFDSFFLQTTTF